MATRSPVSVDPLVQKGRLGQLIMPGDFAEAQDGFNETQDGDLLAFTRIEASEGLSELFEYRVDAVSNVQDIDFTKALGLSCCVSITTYGGETRFFNGILTEAQWVGTRNDLHAYRLTLRPWLWLLGREADCRIFKNMTLIDIAKKIFKEAGFGDDAVYVDIQQDPPLFEYCVQYRETDLAFVSRLFEEYGIYFYFEHTIDKHVLNLVDAPSKHSAISILQPKPTKPGTQSKSEEVFEKSAIIRYLEVRDSHISAGQHFYHWLSERRVRTGRVELWDYDYMKSTTKLKADKQTIETYAKSDREVYDYPGRYIVTGTGQHLAQVKLEAEQAVDHRRFAAGDAVSLFPGTLFTLADHPTDDAEYLVVRVTHSFASEYYRAAGSGGDTATYHGHCDLQRADHPFRAPQITPKPRIYGPQTAFVVTQAASSSEEIDVDKEGRIWVNFHWNRGKPNEDCSRAVRVAQMWAGKSWGWQVIPRVGMEVVVEFLEGDPDQPLVTGCVYNSTYQYPYPLPDKKNISGVKTDSTKGHNGFNELYFDDTKGKELIKMKAELDRLTIVQNTETREIWNWQTEDIGKDYKSGSRKGDDDSRKTTIWHGDDELLVKDGKWLQTIKKDWITEVTEGDKKLTIKKGDETREITAGSFTDTIHQDYKQTIEMGEVTQDIKMKGYTQTLSMGDWSTKCSLGKATFEAMQSIELKVGQSSVKLDQMGVTIKGMMIKVDGQIMTEVKGLMTNVSASALMTVKGAIVMIN